MFATCIKYNDIPVWLSYILFIACFTLISYLGVQERLYCTNERLDIAYDNPSVFCQISGTDNAIN